MLRLMRVGQILIYVQTTNKDSLLLLLLLLLLTQHDHSRATGKRFLQDEVKNDPDRSAPIGKFSSSCSVRMYGGRVERYSAAVDRDGTGLGSHRSVVWVGVARVAR